MTASSRSGFCAQWDSRRSAKEKAATGTFSRTATAPLTSWSVLGPLRCGFTTSCRSLSAFQLTTDLASTSEIKCNSKLCQDRSKICPCKRDCGFLNLYRDGGKSDGQPSKCSSSHSSSTAWGIAHRR